MSLANYTSAYRAKLIASVYKRWSKNGNKVLDVGCGTGIVAKELEKILKIKVSGCDIDTYIAVKIPFKKMAKADKLPFNNKAFDFAMLNDVLHHTKFQNQSKLIVESIRIAKQVLIFELKPTLIGRVGDFVLNKIHNVNMDIPFTYKTEQEWEKTFDSLKIKWKKQGVKSPLWYPFTHVAYVLSKF